MFADFLAILQQVKADKKGVTALEYGVIAAAIVVVGLATVPALAAALGWPLHDYRRQPC